MSFSGIYEPSSYLTVNTLMSPLLGPAGYLLFRFLYCYSCRTAVPLSAQMEHMVTAIQAEILKRGMVNINRNCTKTDAGI
jgi:hypothetical protein